MQMDFMGHLLFLGIHDRIESGCLSLRGVSEADEV